MTKDEIYDAAAQYIDNNHSPAEKEFQRAINIAAVNAFIAGAKWLIEKNVCLVCKGSKNCNKSKSIKDQCINFFINC